MTTREIMALGAAARAKAKAGDPQARENAELKDRITQLEAENAALKKAKATNKTTAKTKTST